MKSPGFNNPNEAPHFIITEAERASGVAPGDVLLVQLEVPLGALEETGAQLGVGLVGLRLKNLQRGNGA